ncbi:Zn(2)-C6 fungal-type domain-containing protein [Mycena chlorophos]|uniref:Zn(2)-C6 fungal-type domain-containing protein n=1 Tax=Mycena chlorophos TaxID=658473 RepID=A0A8H6TGT1_MYCCL|nr:Zn(2)-C6 fungal-type domain-containing protein [Mycena chlorophos]
MGLPGPGLAPPRDPHAQYGTLPVPGYLAYDPRGFALQDGSSSVGAPRSAFPLGGPTSDSHKLSPSVPVVIACRPCRGRKIKCDSSRPQCSNCVRRHTECIYDAAPKRRGPDKNPGTRQRSCKTRKRSSKDDDKSKLERDRDSKDSDPDGPPPAKRQRKESTGPQPSSPAVESGTEPEAARFKVEPGLEKVVWDVKDQKDEKSKSVTGRKRRLSTTSSTAAAASLPKEDLDNSLSRPEAPAPGPPTLRITTDFLAPALSSMPHSSSPLGRAVPPRSSPLSLGPHSGALSPNTPTATSVLARNTTWWTGFLQNYPLNDVAADLTFVFNDAGHWLSFLNLSSLLKCLWSSEDRHSIPPAFVFSCLALAELMRSSELERGATGRARAARLRENAQTALETALTQDEVGYRLAEAAFVLVLYELSAHPLYHPERVSMALQLLDSLLQRLDLFRIDLQNPEAARWMPNCAPVVHVPRSPMSSASPPTRLSSMFGNSHERERRTCRCSALPGASAPDTTLFCSTPPRWDPSWTDMQTRAEECRRLVWSSLGVASAFIAQCAALNVKAPTLRMADCSNYALLFPAATTGRATTLARISPGGYLDRSEAPQLHMQTESVVSLYCRSLLLWNFAFRLAETAKNGGPSAIDPESDAVHEAWSEAQVLEDALEVHTCNYETGISYLVREFVHNTRLCVTLILRGLNGVARDPGRMPGLIFNRKQMVEWLEHQTPVVHRAKFALYQATRRGSLQVHPQQHPFTRRPYQVAWFLNQFAMCMRMWQADNTLAEAVALGKDLLGIMGVLNIWWPCDGNRAHTEALREEVLHACMVVGVDPPPPVPPPAFAEIGLGRL